jgi:hypothetical protein
MQLLLRKDAVRRLLRAAVVPAALAAALFALAAAPAAEALPTGDLWISEVMYDPAGSDDQYEWVELFNAGSTAIDLSDYELRWGGDTYGDYGTLVLSGTLAPGDYFVVGGPLSDNDNGNPTYDQSEDFDGDLGNGRLFGFWADGLALFDTTAGPDPVHVVIYGGFLNLSGLVDEIGNPGAVDAFPITAGSSLEFDGTVWGEQAAPTPGSGSLVPEPAPALLMLMGLVGLAIKGRPRNRPTR